MNLLGKDDNLPTGLITRCGDHRMNTRVVERLFFSNFSFFLSLRRLFRNAKQSIEISLYIFEDDRVGRFVQNQLILAEKRGVKVRIVVDGYGSIDSYLKLRKNLGLYGGEVRIYNPLPWPFAHFYFEDYLRNGHVFPFLSHLNRRNHSKVIIVDSHSVFIGSRNFTSASLSWRETSVLIESSNLTADIHNYFQWLWQKSFYFEKPLFEKPKPFRHSDRNIYFSYPRHYRRQLLRDLVEKIELAQFQIQIIMPYFFPPLKLVKAFCQAAGKGIRIEIILPSKTDVFLFPRMSRVFYKTLLKVGVQLYEYQGVMVHAKQVLIDQWVLVGSSNLNSRSFFHDLEVDYVLTDPEKINQIVKQFEVDKACSKKVEEIDFSESTLSRLLSFLITRIFGGSI